MTPVTAPAPIEAGAELRFLTARCRVLADGAATDDAYGLVDMIEMPAGDMPPLHVHHRHDEGFLVLEGEVTVLLPGRDVPLRAGEFALAPRGVPHAYRVGDTSARILVLSRPGGFEAFVRAVAALEAPTPDALAAVAAAHDIEILGPPGARP
jgi:quercetin dioxygenase-like cupin family protein